MTKPWEHTKSTMDDLAATLIRAAKSHTGEIYNSSSNYDIGYHYGSSASLGANSGTNGKRNLDLIVEQRIRYVEEGSTNKYYDYFLGYLDGLNDAHHLV